MGSRGSQSALSAADSAGDSARWDAVLSHVQFLSGAVECALQAFDTDLTNEKLVSAITRKRMTAKALERLERSQGIVQVLGDGVTELRSLSARWQDVVEAEQSERQASAEAADAATQECSRLQEENYELQESLQACQTRVNELVAKSRSEDQVRQTLEGTIDGLNDDVVALQKRAQDAESAQADMSAEHSQRMSELDAAMEEARAATAQLASAQARAQKAEEGYERAQQAVARFTADNVVFMVKLQKAETRGAHLSTEVAELRAAVEQQSGPWFDEVRASVEARVGESLQAADDLRAELRKVKSEHAEEARKALAEREKLSCHLSDSLASARELEADLKTRRREIKQLRTEASQQADALRAVTAARDEADARVRVVDGERERMKAEWTQMFSSTDSLKSRISALHSELLREQQIRQEATNRVQQLEHQIEVERSINKHIQKLKSDVEYQLMDATARLSATTGSNVPATATDHSWAGGSPGPRGPRASVDAAERAGTAPWVSLRDARAGDAAAGHAHEVAAARDACVAERAAGTSTKEPRTAAWHAPQDKQHVTHARAEQEASDATERHHLPMPERYAASDTDAPLQAFVPGDEPLGHEQGPYRTSTVRCRARGSVAADAHMRVQCVDGGVRSSGSRALQDGARASASAQLQSRASDRVSEASSLANSAAGVTTSRIGGSPDAAQSAAAFDAARSLQDAVAALPSLERSRAASTSAMHDACITDAVGGGNADTESPSARLAGRGDADRRCNYGSLASSRSSLGLRASMLDVTNRVHGSPDKCLMRGSQVFARSIDAASDADAGWAGKPCSSQAGSEAESPHHGGQATQLAVSNESLAPQHPKHAVDEVSQGAHKRSRDSSAPEAWKVGQAQMSVGPEWPLSR